MANEASAITLEQSPCDRDNGNVPTAGVEVEQAARRNGLGRPRRFTKTQVTLRIDNDVIEWLKAAGPGWQSRMNDALCLSAGV